MTKDLMGAERAIMLGKGRELKGGENHHQEAYAFRIVSRGGKPGALPVPIGASVLDAEDLGAGKREMGWTNVCDAGTCLRTYTDMGEIFGKSGTPYFACASKHGRIVIAALGETQKKALMKALAADVNSPFGGIFGFNRPLEMGTAEALDRMFIEGVIAPGYEKGAPELLQDTGGVKAHANRFVLKMPGVITSDLNAAEWDMRFAGCAVIVQEYDSDPFLPLLDQAVVASGNGGETDILSLGKRYKGMTDDIKFAGNMARHLNSNLIVYAANRALVGFGNSRGSRVFAARDGRRNMEESVWNPITRPTDESWERALYGTPFERDEFEGLGEDFNLVAFSDAFYPHPDAWIESVGIDRVSIDFNSKAFQCCGKKIILKRNNFDPNYNPNLVTKAVVQPGGCMGDKYTLELSGKYNIPMVFTMTPEQFKQYQAGERVTGRRFFSHQSF